MAPANVRKARHLAHKAEHAVDLSSGALLAIEDTASGRSEKLHSGTGAREAELGRQGS